MKRVLSLVLVLVLVLGSFPVFADTTTYGEQLFEMGLLKGDENGNLNEDSILTRAEMMVVLARLYGVEDEAMAFPLPSTFTDVPADAWYAPYVAYAQLEGWTVGYGDGTFGPNDAVSEQMVATFMLRALGYDVVWETAVADAAELGIDAVASTPMLRGEVFEMMFDTINTENTEGEVLGEVLGVLEPAVPEVLEVVSIDVINLVEMEVVFNTELDEDELGDFDVEDHTLTVDLLDDGTTVLVTFDNDSALDNQEEFELEIDGTTSVDGELTLEDFVSDELTAFDATIPVALGVELTGPDTFEITFSEPVVEDEEIEVVVESGVYGVAVDQDGTTVVEVTLGADLEEGDYEVEVSGAYDYAGFKALDKTFVLEFVEDDDAPVAVVDSVNETEVVLVFDENVFFYDDDDDEILSEDEELVDFFYHSYTAYNPDVVAVDGDEVTLSFDDNPLPEGTVKIVVDVDAEDGYIQDAWGNEIESNLVFFVEVVVDDAAPEVVSIETETDDPYTIDIYFSEDVLEWADEDNYVLLDSDDEEIDIDDVDYEVTDDDEYIVTIEADEMLEGSYTIEISGLTDDSLLVNEMEEVTLAFTKVDENAPLLEDVEAEYVDNGDELVVYVMFEEDMATEGAYSILDPENYIIGGYEIDLDDDSIELFGGADAVKIVLDGKSIEDLDDEEVEIARLADAEGNKTADLYVSVTMTEVEALEIIAVSTIDDNHVEVVVDGKLVSVTADGFIVEDADSSHEFAAVSYSYDSDDDETTVIATIKSYEQMEYPDETPVAVYVVAEELEDDKGQYMAEQTFEDIEDGWAPSFDEDQFEDDYDYEMTTSDSLVLVFDEDMDENDYLAADFVIEVNGDELVAFTDFDVELDDDDELEITFYIDLEVDDDITIEVEDADYVTDEAGNAVEDFDFEVTVIEDVK